MMKAILTIAFLAIGCMGVHASAQQENTNPPAAQADAKSKLEAVPQALKKLSTFNGKVNTEAEYYIYLQSASWCGPCRAEMPEIVEKYKEMKKDGVELVLISHDHSKGDAKDYVKEFKAKFPVHFSKKKKVTLPGFKMSSSVPHATLVDAKGKVLLDDHPARVLPKYESLIKEHRKANGSAKSEDNSGDKD